MTFLSYAPNCEDVVLWRALGDVPLGFYLEWDAVDPGALTRALHARHWRGLTIVATQDQADALAGARPDDHVIVASSLEPGTLAAAVAAMRVDDVHVARLNVPSDASSILPLSPWIVVVRAGDEQAIFTLAASGFRLALSDGVNHFYVAAAHFDRLAPRLLAAADNADDDRRIADLASTEQVAAMEALVAVSRLRETASSERMLDAVRSVGIARAEMAEEAKWLRGLVDEARSAEKDARAEAAWRRGLWDDEKGLTTHLKAELDRRHSHLEASQRDVSALQHRIAELDPQVWRIVVALGRRALARVWRRLRPVQTPRVPIDGTVPPVGCDPAALVQADMTPEPALTATASVPVMAAPAVDIAVERPIPHRAPIRTVHQFHAGSAPGNAITNGMLLIRDVLRGCGFRSDIYVVHRAKGLEAHDIFLSEDLPDHDGFVLLVHHSMGYPEFDQIVALPAPKILIYHNITPPQFLGATPRIEQMARLGREQLATLRDHVVAALAVSDYNAMELHALHFPVVRTCPLLFDVTSLAKAASGDRISDGVFTILFVGRVTPSKGQDGLIEAFAQFRTIFDRPSRLVLVGALDTDEHQFLTRLETLIATLGLRHHVQLTGLVSDEELRDWYRQADLYLSLSQHEGFCVPLVEAMAHGVPVLAWPSGAVAETLDDDGALLASRDPHTVADRILHATSAKPSGAGLARFALERHVPTLLQVLAAAGAFPPPSRAAHAQLAANFQVAIAGHVGKSYSLAGVNRAIAAALERERPGTVRMIPVEGVPTSDLSEVPAEDRALVQCLSLRGRPVGAPELCLSQHYPVYVPPDPADLKAAFFFWEESLIPAATVATLNRGFDAVFAPSRFVARALVNSGVSIPVMMIGHAPVLHDVEAAKQGPFTFLHVSSAFPRKGVDLLLAAWRETFSAHDPVRLILKTFPNPHNGTAHQLASLRADANIAPVELIDADLSAGEMHLLLCQADAMVLPTRGEGYNLPAAEAMAAGIPLITTGIGGHLDFCSSATARLVAYRLAPSGSHLATPHSLWAEPDVADLTRALREVFTAGRDGLLAQRQAARSAIAQAINPADWTARLAAASAALLLAPAAPPTRIAWISTWNVKCGIAEYSRALLEAMPKTGMTILADERISAAANVRVAWRLGDSGNVGRLIQATGRLDADIVVVQHQPGLMSWTMLAELVTQLTQRGRGVVVTLHNTRELVESPDPGRAAVVAALDRAARVLVHTLADVQALQDIGLSNPAVLVPHAAPAAAPAAASVDVRALPAGSAPIIGCTGFFLPGKGIGPLIQAVASLRDRWPAIQLRLVNAEYDHPSSAEEVAACRALAASEGLEVDWRTSFLPLDEIGANLRGCDLLVLPYERSKESSSAALRTALGAGIPVAVTPLPLFDEARQAVATLSGSGVSQLAQGISSLLEDEAERTRLQRAASEWLSARDVSVIARRLAGMMEGLAAQRRIGQHMCG